MKTNKSTISTTVTAALSQDGTHLIISLPLNANPKLTKNQKNYVVCETGTWPQNWVTVNVEGQEVGLTVCGLVKNMEHPDNQPKPEPVIPAAPKFFQKRSNVSGNGNGKPSTNGVAKRIMPGSCA